MKNTRAHSPRVPTLEEVRSTIGKYPQWFHRIPLPHGTVTPGVANSEVKIECLKEIGLPEDCRGLRVLDIGCMEGYFSFELERRGAEVTAIDRGLYPGSKFEAVQSLLGSRVRYEQGNVYNLDSRQLGTFDLILFLGVLYHLRYPLLALDAIRSVCKETSKLFLNTLLIDEHMPNGLLPPTGLRELAPEVQTIPLWRYYQGSSLAGDITNSFVPNAAAVRAALADSQFVCEAQYCRGVGGFFRAVPEHNSNIETWVRQERT